MADDEIVQGKIVVDASGVKTGVDQAKGHLNELEESGDSLVEKFGELKTVFLEAFAIKEVAELVEHVAELGEQAILTSMMLGMSVESVQKLGFAAQMTGGNAEGLEMGMMRLERNMAEAQSGTGKAAQAFEALGITQEQLKNSSPEQVLNLIANRFSETQDGAAKTAIAMDLLGRTGAQMIPLFDQGAEGLKKMGEAAQQTGSILNDVQAEGLATTSHEIVTLKQSVEGAGIALVEIFHPAIDGIIVGLTSLVQECTEVFNGLRLISQIIETTIVLAFAKLIELFMDAGTTGHKYIEEIKIEFENLGQVIDDVVHGHFQQAVDDWKTGTQMIAASEAKAAAEIAKSAKDYEDLKSKILDATAAKFAFAKANEEKEKKEKLTAPTQGKEDTSDDKEQQAIEKSDLARELEINKLKIAAKKDADQALVESGKMTKQQQLADLITFTQQEEQLSLQALDKEMALYDKDSAQWEQLHNKKLILEQQYSNQIAKLQTQALNEQKKEYDHFFQSISQAADQMVTGILRGTQTWQQAMGRLFENLLTKFIEDMVVQPTVKFLESQAQQLISAETKNTAIAASDASTNATSMASIAAKLLKTITGDAATTFSGVFAFLSPVMGPAAAGPATASAASVSAMSSLVQLDVGAYNLNSDMVAQLHKGEMVVPQTFAEGLRNGGGSFGGGDTYNFSFPIQSIDTQTGVQFLKNNAQVIGQVIATQIRLGDKTLTNAMKS